jgi:hypothetical protein
VQTDKYDENSCNALQKPFYSPLEATLRWCNLVAHETEILSYVGDKRLPAPGDFPHWPCLRNNCEMILDAIEHGELAYGRDGKEVRTGETVAMHRMTIRHVALKAWMTANFPDQKPQFLFDDVERDTHPSISADTYRSLQADRERLVVEKAANEKRIWPLTEKVWALTEENERLKSQVAQLKSGMESLQIGEEQLHPRTERTYQHMIAALLDCVLGTHPKLESRKVFPSEKQLIAFIDHEYDGYEGLSESTLSRKFPEAKRQLKG